MTGEQIFGSGGSVRASIRVGLGLVRIIGAVLFDSRRVIWGTLFGIPIAAAGLIGAVLVPTSVLLYIEGLEFYCELLELIARVKT